MTNIDAIEKVASYDISYITIRYKYLARNQLNIFIMINLHFIISLFFIDRIENGLFAFKNQQNVMAYKVQNYVNGLPNLRDENPESILEVLYA